MYLLLGGYAGIPAAVRIRVMCNTHNAYATFSSVETVIISSAAVFSCFWNICSLFLSRIIYTRVMKLNEFQIGVVLVIYNHRRVKKILQSQRYSLGAKFQLQENMRAFKV